MNYLIKLCSNSTTPTKAGYIFHQSLMDCILTELNRGDSVPVLVGSAFEPHADCTTIGSTVVNSCYLRQGYLYLKITPADDSALKIINDVKYHAFPSIKIEAGNDDVFEETEEGKVVHAAGPVSLKNILFCTDG